MSFSSFFQKGAPPTYSEKDVVKNKSGLDVIGPSDNDQSILFDVHRSMENVFINGTSILELRKHDLLNQKERELYDMSNDAINKMSLDQIQRMMSPDGEKTTLDNKKNNTKYTTDESARIAFIEYLAKHRDNINKIVGFSPKDGHSMKEYKDFLKNHLLKECGDQEEKEFLTETYARGSHQSGFPKMAEMPITSKSNELIGQGSNVSLQQPTTRRLNLTYNKKKSISILSDLQYASVIHTVTDPETHLTSTSITSSPEDSYFARVISKVHLSAIKDNDNKESGGKFTVQLQGDPVLIDIRKDDKHEDINQFISKVFADPRRLLQKILEFIVEKIFKTKQKIMEQSEPVKQTHRPAH